MGNPGEELKPEPYILHEDTVRDPTGILRLIRQYHRENNFRAAMQWFEKLDRTLSQPGKPPPQQWTSMEEKWLTPDHLEFRLGRTLARLKLQRLTLPATRAGTRQLTWNIYLLDPLQEEELSNAQAIHPYAMGMLHSEDVPHYYADREDDFWAHGRDRVYTLMYAINESVKDE